MAADARSPLPVVDLSLPPEEAAVVLKTACEGAGFFYLVNHGVPRELLSRVLREMEHLFSLPPQEKKLLSQDRNNRGYTPVGEEVLDPGRQRGRGDTKEGFYIGEELPEDHPRARFPLHGPNVWPNPALLPGFRPTMEAYYEACRGVCRRVLVLMALALRLPGDFFLLPGRFDHAMAFLRLLRYTGEESRPEEGVFGAGAHTDYGMVTLLATWGPGLQICRAPEEVPQRWEDVAAVEGAYVVNVGDMLERWTNGRWKSTLHRVVIPPGAQRPRYSAPFFFEPNFECPVQPLPCCTSPQHPPRWGPTTAGEHLLNMYSKTHLHLDASLKLPRA